VDDGYKDQAAELLGNHKPAGPLRGGKYSLFDGGTRVAFVVQWPGKITPGTTDVLFSQIDLLASFAALTGQSLAKDDAPDSFNYVNALIGKSKTGREWLVEHSGRLTLIKGEWKFIEPGPGAKLQVNTNTETGNDSIPQLYNLKTDLGERNNLADKNPLIVKEYSDFLKKIRADGRTKF